MAMSENELHAALVGDTGVTLSAEFVVGIRALVDWPVDAYFVDLETTGRQVVGWLSGNSIGIAVAQDVVAGLTITANVYPIRRIHALRVGVLTVPNNRQSRYDVARSLEIEFTDNESISVDVSLHTTQHTRREADHFVSSVLAKLAKGDR